MHDYLQTELWLQMNVTTLLTSRGSPSATVLNLQFADMPAALIQSHVEDERSEPWELLRDQIARTDLDPQPDRSD